MEKIVTILGARPQFIKVAGVSGEIYYYRIGNASEVICNELFHSENIKFNGTRKRSFNNYSLPE